MAEASAQKQRPFLIAGLAAVPSIVLLAMNTIEWRTGDFETIVLAYQVAIYVGLLIALIAIFLAIRQLRRGGSHKTLALSIAIAAAFIVWVGPDAYLDFAEVISGAFGSG
jgi:cation transport ATPase